MKNFIKKLWGAEFFTFRIYKLFTEVRKSLFWFLVIFCIISPLWLNLDISDWFPLWSQEILTLIAVKMIYLLLSIGAFTAAFITIAIEIIKTKPEARSVTAIWSNLVKYASYPFVVAMIIGSVLVMRDVGVYNHISSSIFLLFVYLTINSFYTTIRAAEILVNEAWQPEKED